MLKLKEGNMVVLKSEVFISPYKKLKYRILEVMKIRNNDIRGEHICYYTRRIKPFHFTLDEVERFATEEEVNRHSFKSKAKKQKDN